jgi:hypothetical protein
MPTPKRRPAAAAKPRGYSRAFPVDGAGARYLVDQIPPSLWRKVKAKAKRDGRSIRNITLAALLDYINTDD